MVLWLQNDELLSIIAKACGTYALFRWAIKHGSDKVKKGTPDGVKWGSHKINKAEVNQAIWGI